LLEVAWPCGAKESFRDLQSNELSVIKESAGIVRREKFKPLH
jgi:hypothetical protein